MFYFCVLIQGFIAVFFKRQDQRVKKKKKKKKEGAGWVIEVSHDQMVVIP